MKPWVWLLLVLPLPVLAGDPLIRLVAEPAGELTPGQSLELRIQLLVPSYFLSAPVFPELRLNDGSRATPGESQNLNLRIDGEDYAGIQRTYHFPPLRPGHYQLRPQTLTVRYADPQNLALESQLSLPDLALSVAWRADASAHQATPQAEPQLRLSERYSANSEPWYSGDILQRELRVELHGAGSLLPPSPSISEPVGTRLYRLAPELSADTQRGAQISVREEQLRYLLLAPGIIELPAVCLQWRDTRSGRLQQVELPARQLHVLERPSGAAPYSKAPAWLAGLGSTVLLILIGAALGRSYLRARYAEYQRWRAVRLACRAQDARAVERALENWLSGLAEHRQVAICTALRGEIERLQHARYGSQPGRWQADTLLRQASSARARAGAGQDKPVRGSRLNP
ncbi:MAG TPA: hypothetical protein VFE95_08575 [Pseudomonas sp.]|nr:hypothetical protein [Pseudomonas sp.]